MRIASVLAASLLAAGSPAFTAAGPADPRSERTLRVAVQVDRDAARLVAYSVEDRRFEELLPLPEIRGSKGSGMAQLEVALTGAEAAPYVTRLDVGPICLEHAAGTPAPHRRQRPRLPSPPESGGGPGGDPARAGLSGRHHLCATPPGVHLSGRADGRLHPRHQGLEPGQEPGGVECDRAYFR